MKIVDRQALLAMPTGTMFSKYVPCVLGEVRLKGATVNGGSDFWYQNVADAAMCDDTTHFFESLDGACGNSVYVHLDTEHVRCEGDLEDGQHFAVWEVPDVRNFVTRLTASAPMDRRRGEYVAPDGIANAPALSPVDCRLPLVKLGDTTTFDCALRWTRSA